MTSVTDTVESGSQSDDFSEGSESQYTYGDDSTVLSLRHTSRDDGANHSTQARSGSGSSGKNPHTVSQMAGAALAGGVAGCLVGGPVVGAIAAGASALAATSRSPPGKVVRAGGEAVARVGTQVSTEMQALDEKHSLSPRFQNATQSARNQWAAMDEKHQWTQRSRQAMSGLGDRVQKFDEKHHILDRASDGWCAKRFEPRPEHDDNDNDDDHGNETTSHNHTEPKPSGMYAPGQDMMMMDNNSNNKGEDVSVLAGEDVSVYSNSHSKHSNSKGEDNVSVYSKGEDMMQEQDPQEKDTYTTIREQDLDFLPEKTSLKPRRQLV
jgi:hypothetical protein